MSSSSSSLSELLPAFVNLDLASGIDHQALPESYIGERLFVSEYINDTSIPGFSLARCRVEPGVVTELHSLSVHEWYVIESGQGLMKLADQEVSVGIGSVVQIPSGTAQSIINTGDQDLIFFCVCTPRFTPDSYFSHE